MENLTQRLVNLLFLTLNDSEHRLRWLGEFQDLVWNPAEPIEDKKIDEIFLELAGDLDLYEPREDYRREDPSFFGDEQFEVQVRSALHKLAELGVRPSPAPG